VSLKLQDFAGRHQGETIIICGCGRSLTDLRDPARFITIGVNDVGRLFDPFYLVVVNSRGQFKGDRFRYVEHSRARFVFSQFDLHLAHAPTVQVRLGQRGGTQFDDPGVLHYTQNSPYVATCLAVHMGARRIGIIGVDFSDHHFFGPTGPHALSRQLGKIDAEYRKLGQALNLLGIEVFNLGRDSRLTAFPKMNLETFAQLSQPHQKAESWPLSMLSGRVDSPTAPLAGPSHPRILVSVQKLTPGIPGDFLEALAATIQRLGHKVSRNTSEWAGRRDAVSIVWNGRSHRGAGRCIYCEHGWLPRWSYQLSFQGINADSHLAPFVWDGRPLTEAERARVCDHLLKLRAEAPSALAYARPDLAAAADLPEAFILAPLQMIWDTNIQRHVAPEYRSMQKWIDTVSASNPPFPILFKQHPADMRRGNEHLRLRLRRPQDRVLRHAAANVHQILKTGRCRCIIALNSNVVHDGLIWDVPSIALGRNIWPDDPPLPILRALPPAWDEVERFFSLEETRQCREAYVGYLLQNQWSLADAQSEEKVDGLLSDVRDGSLRRTMSPGRPRVTVSNAPMINVVALNRGWFFEDLKRHFSRAASPTRPVVTSEKPRPDAASWIFIRTREAGTSTDPDRTLVQIHDLFDGGRYEQGGEREAVARCAAVMLTHPDQKAILEQAGVSLSGKQVLLQPTGALEAFQPRRTLSPRFTIAWVGRPVVHDGVEIKRVHWLVDAVRQLRLPRLAYEIVLLGERLESQHRELLRAGCNCRYLQRREHPIDKYPAHYRTFDCVVITSLQEAGPNCLFEALASGVPVISTPVGWAPRLVRPGENGFLVESIAELVDRLRQLHDQRTDWFDRQQFCHQSVAQFTLESFVNRNLEAAAALVRHPST
jgi:glycosyltransferase involved in cell wall biosynthesis